MTIPNLLRLTPWFAAAALCSAAPVQITFTPAELDLRTRHLGSEILQERRAASEWLGRAGDKAAPAVPGLIRALEDPDDLVRRNAAWALGKIKIPAETVVPALAARLTDANEHWTVRHNASLSLSWIGEPAVTALTRLLEAPLPETRASAASGLVRMEGTPPAEKLRPVLARLLSDPALPIRLQAANVVGLLGPAGAPHAPDVLRLLEEEDAGSRVAALKALNVLGPLPEEVRPRIRKALQNDPDQWVRIGAVLCLASGFRDDPETVPLLVAALGDRTERVAHYAVQALVNYGETVVPVLCETLRAEQKSMRLRASEALAFIGDKAGRHAGSAAVSLVPLLSGNEDWEVRARAATAIGFLGQATPEILRALESARKDEHEIVRLNSEGALAKLVVVSAR